VNKEMNSAVSKNYIKYCSLLLKLNQTYS